MLADNWMAQYTGLLRLRTGEIVPENRWWYANRWTANLVYNGV